MRRRTVFAIVLLIVLGRSAIFLLFPESYFDSDQAIVGLMAKHLAERRAFPVFLYGGTYMLGVEAWLAAPLFLVCGASVAMLKLPLLAVNAVIAVLLVTTFERELGLRPEIAAVAAMSFILPAVGLAAVFMEPSGGNVEPFLYVVLLWLARRRPLVCGAILGIGFLHREFTIYGAAALICIDALDRTLLSRANAKRWATIVGVAAGVWIVVQGLKQLSSASGPGTSVADTFTASNNLAELLRRTCISPATALTGAGDLVRLHWPAILGTAPYPLSAFAIESRVSQGFPGSAWLPAALVVLAAIGIVLAARSPAAIPRPRFAQYLLLTGLFSPLGYVLGRCGEVSFYTVRYELLSVLGLCGLSAWFLSRPAPPMLRAAWAAVFAAWMTVIVVPHVRFAAEYATHPPVAAKHTLIRALEARGIRYGRADYWLAYYIDFLTKERMIFAATAPARILIYDRIVGEHAGEAVELSRQPCTGGVVLVPGVYQCR